MPWRCKPWLPLVLLLAFAVPAEGVARHVAAGGSDAGNNCSNPAAPCATFQHAVDQAVSGDTIEIAPGSYNQRVRIIGRQDLTVNAAGVTLRPDLAVVGSPDVEQGSPCSGLPGRSVVLVRDSTGIVLNGLTIDGSDALMAPTEPARWIGIFYRSRPA